MSVSSKVQVVKQCEVSVNYKEGEFMEWLHENGGGWL